FIEVKFDDGSTDRFEKSGAKGSKIEFINVSKLNSFLSYKELLRIYFVDSDEVNFFNLLIENILAQHSLESLGKLSDAWLKFQKRDLIEETKTIENSLVPEN